jgi:hypothetical protein
MGNEEEREKTMKQVEATRPKPVQIDAEALGLRERHAPIEQGRDDRVHTMLTEALNRLAIVERKIDDLQVAIHELSRSW